MRTFNHLSLEERERFYAWKEQGISYREIGRRLGRKHTTLSREFKRNAKYGQPYIPCIADRKAEKRVLKQRYRAPLKEPLIFLYVRTRLRDWKWSPETISGRLPIDHPGYSIDDETIYRYVYGRKQTRMKLWEHLVLHRRKRMKKDGRKVQAYGRLNEAISIKERPSIITARIKPGDWETDNMEGKRSDATAVSVTVDRMTRITRLWKLTDHTAQTKADSLVVQLKQEDPILRGSITCDRGSENSNHNVITNMHRMPVYACDPYHSWEKGTVENTIGRLRRFIPKGRSVDEVSQKKLDRIEKTMNNTPRKCLGYLTPNEYLEKILSASHTA
ncbi:MAG: IS30 family transposase [Bacteroidetes bacterium]|nr:MAG: IS30 family transposase [Bacteroidota bacterium]